MNKSKFLKKSLAMLLAIMMVIAVIPLGASAATSVTINDDDIFSVSVNAGEIEKVDDTTLKVTLPYDAAAVTLTVVPVDDATFTDVYAGVDDADPATQSGTNIALTSLKAGDKKTVKFFAVTSTYNAATPVEGTYTATYTVNVEVTTASTSLELKEASYTPGSGTAIKGEVSGTSIVFTLPWGINVPTDLTGATPDGTIEYTLVNPKSSATPAVTVAKTDITYDKDTGTGEIKAETQRGTADYLSFEFKNSDGLSILKVGDQTAVQDEKKPLEYKVTFPVGTDLSTLKPVVKATYAVEPKTAYLNYGTAAASASTDELKAPNDVVTQESDATKDYYLTLEDASGNKISYKVIVEVTKNSEAEVVEFTAVAKDTAGNDYPVVGTISGKTLNMELPKDAGAHAVVYTIKASDKATVTGSISGSTLTASGTSYVANVASAAKVENAKIVVKSEDGKNTTNYVLNVTIAETSQEDPSVESLTLKLGDNEYEGKINGTDIEIADIPYSTTPAAVQAEAAYSIKLNTGSTEGGTLKTAVNAINFGKDGAKEFVVSSDGGQSKTYTLTLTKAQPETGKVLESFSFTNATDGSKIAEATENYESKITSKKVSFELPYSVFDDNTTTAYLNGVVTLSKGASAYGVATDSTKFSVGTALDASLAFDDKTPFAYKNGLTLKGADVASLAGTQIIVLDEFATVEIRDNLTTIDTIAGVQEEKTLAGHYTVYEVAVTQAPAKTGSKLIDLKDENGEATTKVAANGFEITMPNSYTTGHPYTVSTDEMATLVLTAGSEIKVKNGDTVTLGADGPDANGDYALTVDVSGTMTKVTNASVLAENGNSTAYSDFTVKVNAAEKGAEITSLKVNDEEATLEGKTFTVSILNTDDIKKVTITGEKSKLSNLTASSGTVASDVATTEIKITDADASSDITLVVTAEDTKTKNTYTLKVTADKEPEVEPKFSDIPEKTEGNSWYYDSVMEAAEIGLVTGLPDGTFDPTGDVTREMFAALVVRLLGKEDEAKEMTTDKFTDVGAGNWAIGYIAYCAENGIVNGTGDGTTFSPRDIVNREQAATLLARAMKLEDKADLSTFEDAGDVSSWAVDSIAQAVKAGLIEGNAEGKLIPKTNLTRAQAAVILVRAYHADDAE